MKNKKWIIIWILLILLIFTVYIINYNSINKKISRDLGIYIPSSLEFEHEDSHGGFHGDGILLAEANLNEKQVKQIIDKSDTSWNKNPMPPETREIIYNRGLGDKDTEFIEPSRGIEEIENGYWIFNDRRSEESKERFPGTVIGNYSVGIINLDSNIFYYIKFDS